MSEWYWYKLYARSQFRVFIFCVVFLLFCPLVDYLSVCLPKPLSQCQGLSRPNICSSWRLTFCRGQMQISERSGRSSCGADVCVTFLMWPSSQRRCVPVCRERAWEYNSVCASGELGNHFDSEYIQVFGIVATVDQIKSQFFAMSSGWKRPSLVWVIHQFVRNLKHVFACPHHLTKF